MKITIRYKLIIAISALMVVLFVTASYLFIKEKKTEMAEDIYVNALAFSRLTAPTVAYNYDLYLAQNSFVYFNREIASLFEQNDDIAKVAVISYTGEILYDSRRDSEKQYWGEAVIVEDQTLLEQLKSENISVLTQDGRLVFIKSDLIGNYKYVDADEKNIGPLEPGVLIQYLVVPANEEHSVIYTLDYHNLEARVARVVERIIYLALFGIMLGMILSFLMSSQITKPILQLVEGAGKIAKGDFKTRVNITTRDELSFLGQAFNKMAIDLEASVEARLYKERVTRELELATQIQQQLIPKQLPKIQGLELAAGLVPAEEIGGDIYDFLTISDGRLLMYLGDVTGHGVPAGIVSSIASALFYGYSVEADLKKILVEVNRVMKAKTMPTMFMTLCLMDFDAATGSLNYASAGHEQIIHYKVGTGVAELEPAGGIALGMLPDISKQVEVRSIDFKPGDFLVIYSDGIPEAWKSKTENYGMDRFKAVVERSANLDVTAIKDAILADVKEFRAGYTQMDDITLLIVKRV